MLDEIALKIKHMNSNMKLLIVSAIVGGILYTRYVDTIEPAHENLSLAKEDARKLEETIKNRSSDSGLDIAALQAEIKKNEDELASLFHLLPKELQIDNLLSIFAQAADESGVDMLEFIPQAEQKFNTSLNPGTNHDNVGKPSDTKNIIKENHLDNSDTNSTPNSDNKVNKVFIKVKSLGRYDQLLQFIEKTLSTDRLIRIGSFRIVNTKQTAGVTNNNQQVTDNGLPKKAKKDLEDPSPILESYLDFYTFSQSVSETTETVQQPKTDIPTENMTNHNIQAPSAKKGTHELY